MCGSSHRLSPGAHAAVFECTLRGGENSGENSGENKATEVVRVCSIAQLQVGTILAFNKRVELTKYFAAHEGHLFY